MRTPPMMPMAMEVTRRTLNTRAAITTEWDNFSVISGVDRQENKHAGNMYMRDANPIPPLDGDLRFESYGAFSEWTYRLNPNNKLVAGARFDHVKADSAENDQERTDTNPSGFIRIESTLPEHGFKTYAGIGYVERSPDYWELYSTATDHGNGSTNMMGQSSYLMVNNLNNLKTEKTAQLDIGFEQQHGAWNTWASAYAGLINDFILVRYNAPNASQMYPLANNVDATIAGAEAGVGYQFNEHLQADLSAMYAWGENTTDNKPLPQIAPLEGRLNLRYVQEKYSLGLLWRAVAEQNRISLNDGNIVGYDMGKSKAFSTLAMNATYKYSEALDFSVGIDNLLDKAYSEHLNKSGAALFGYAANEQFNNIGRNYWARVSMKF